jgi:hypothetical protein
MDQTRLGGSSEIPGEEAMMKAEHRDEWVSYCSHTKPNGYGCDCAPDVGDVVAERDAYEQALRMIADGHIAPRKVAQLVLDSPCGLSGASLTEA